MFIYELLDIQPIEHAVVQKVFKSGADWARAIYPTPGYVLHDARIDSATEDGQVIPCYRLSETTVPANYDFEQGGKFQFYTISKDTINEQYII